MVIAILLAFIAGTSTAELPPSPRLRRTAVASAEAGQLRLATRAAETARYGRQNQTSVLLEARRLINAGDAKGALAKLRELPPDPDGPRQVQITHLIGVAYYHADDPAKAVDTLQPILDRLPADSTEHREAEQILGLAAFVLGRFADAIPRLEATRRLMPDNLELTYALGQAYIQTQKPDDARRIVASAYKVDSESAAAYLIAAQMMVRLEMEEQATAALTKALAIDQRMPNANYLLGQMALFRGRLEDAIKLTERELALNPGHAMAWSQLGDAYTRQAKWTDAISALQKSIWLNPYYSAPYILLGRSYVKTEQPARAESMLRRAVQYDPNNRSAHYLLAQVLQQMGRTEEAKREFDIAERLTGSRTP